MERVRNKVSLKKNLIFTEDTKDKRHKGKLTTFQYVICWMGERRTKALEKGRNL